MMSQSCLNAQKPLVAIRCASTPNTSSAKAPVFTSSNSRAANCRNVTTLPQLAGALRLPNGWANTLALQGRPLVGLMKQTCAASREALFNSMVLYALGKSTDHMRSFFAPYICWSRARTINISRSCGQYVSLAWAVWLTCDIVRSSMTLNFCC